MSELAFNLNGDAFEVPTNAAGWRVRKMKTKGAPEVAYGRNGQPLVLPLEADVDDLRAEVGSPGRYRLDPVDQENKPIDKAPAGYVMVHELAPAVLVPTTTAGLAPLPAASDSVVLEAMRMNAEITRTVVDRFPQMMEAAATLLRAADGAGLPSRVSRVIELDGEDEAGDDEDAIVAPPGFDLNALVAQLVPVLVANLMSGKIKVPGLAAMFDWRKASATAEPVAPREGATSAKAARVAAPVPSNNLPALDPAAMGHIIEIQSALQPSEVTYVQQVAQELSAAELRGWFDKLNKLSVPEAVETIRGLIAGNPQAGGAS